MSRSTIPDGQADEDAPRYADTEVARAYFDTRGPGVPILRGVIPLREEEAPSPLVPELLSGDGTLEGEIRLSCSCGHLVHPLGPADRLPEHICTLTMLASVRQYIADEWTGAMREGLSWPLLQDQRRLMLVVRQLVYEPSKENPDKDWLTRLLEHRTLWPRLVDVVRKSRPTAELRARAIEAMVRQGVVTRAEAERDLERFMTARGHDRWPLQEVVYEAALGDEYMLGLLLHMFGLPNTPAQRAYFRAQVAGASVTAPGRGVLVTTKVYAESLEAIGVSGAGHPFRWEWNEERQQASVLLMTWSARHGSLPEPLADVWFHDGHPTFEIKDVGGRAPDALIKRANQVKKTTGEWLSHWRPSIFRDQREKARALGAYDEPKTLSYLQEALDLRHRHALKKSVLQRPWGIDEIITEHLDACYRVVFGRLKRAGLPTEVEPGWRETARPALRKYFEQSLP